MDDMVHSGAGRSGDGPMTRSRESGGDGPTNPVAQDRQRAAPMQSTEELLAAYPVDSRIWVKCLSGPSAQQHLAAVVTGTTVVTRTGRRQGRFLVKWLHDPSVDHILASTNLILRTIYLPEWTVLISGDRLGASLTLVREILENRAVRPLVPPRELPRGPNGILWDESGIVFTADTQNFPAALTWLSDCDAQVPFDPFQIVGRNFSVPREYPGIIINYDQANPRVPTLGNCLMQGLLVLQQLEPGSVLHQKLQALVQMLPLLLLHTTSSKITKVQLDRVARKWCQHFMHGQWADLFKAALKAVKPKKKSAPSRPQNETSRKKAVKAAARAGNLSKAHTLLVSAGFSQHPQAVEQLRLKHPDALNHVQLPAEFPDPKLTEEAEEKLLYSLSRENLAKVARKGSAGKARDQWGWYSNEFFAPMLDHEELGNLVVSQLTLPYHKGYFPPLYAVIYRGGCMMALDNCKG